MAPKKRGGPSTPQRGRGGRGRGTGRAGFQGSFRQAATFPQGRFIGANGFTMADEALHTSSHDHSPLGTNLRSRPVAFISVGTIEPLKLLDEILSDEQKSLEAEDVHPANSPTDAVEREIRYHSEVEEKLPTFDQSLNNIDPVNTDQLHSTNEESPRGDEKETMLNNKPDMSMLAEPQVEPNPHQEETFFFDLKGNGENNGIPKIPVFVPDRPSSRSSSSSEEVILFRGRDRTKQSRPAPELNATVAAEIKVEETRHQDIQNNDNSRPQRLKKEKVKHTARRKSRLAMYEEEAMADYIANMKESGEAFNSYDRGQIDTGELDEVSETERHNIDPSSDGDSDDQFSIPDIGHAKGNRLKTGHCDKLSGSITDELDDLSESEHDGDSLVKLVESHGLGGDDDVNFGDALSDLPGPSKQGPQHDPLPKNYDGMDWNQPSLRQKKYKGARAQPNFNCSDSELEQKLHAAWKGDRLKKSERKKQREKQRALGMLGKKSKPEDLRVKYPHGMSIEEVAEELKTFLMGFDEALTLPPMDNHARKMVHELANKFNIKSKSTGKADQRRPTLYRTNLTLQYTDSTFDNAIGRIQRRYFPRLHTKGKRARKTAKTQSSHDEASYQDGEVVGATAPELGVQNRGRAMLEKMGWSSGTALGTVDNKGILQPVTHTMKRSKAGLG